MKSEIDISSLSREGLLAYMKQLHQQNLIKIAAAEAEFEANRVKYQAMMEKLDGFMNTTGAHEEKRKNSPMIF